jgi:hypothetical protein
MTELTYLIQCFCDKQGPLGLSFERPTSVTGLPQAPCKAKEPIISCKELIIGPVGRQHKRF